MKLLFRADGSQQKGMGDVHDTSCIAAEFDGHEILFASTQGEPGYDALVRSGKHVIPLAGSPEAEAAQMHSIIASMGLAALVLFVPHNYPTAYYREIRRVAEDMHTLVVGRYTPHVAVQDFVDIVLSCGDPLDDQTGGPPFFEGPEYIALPRAIKYVKHRSSVRRSARNVLVFLGAGDHPNATERVLLALRDRGLKYTWHVVLGEANENNINRTRFSGNFKFYNGMPQHSFMELMASCDLGIAAGGTTAFELAYLGVPSLLFALDEHQPRNINALASRGAAVSMGPIADLDGDSLLGAIVEITSDISRLQAMSLSGRRAVDGMGANRIKELILDRVRSGAKV